MSFFRNLRSSITRGRSSSRDTTPVNNSRPGSVISSGGMGRRRDSIESGSDSIFQRSDTFVLDDPATNESALHSNTSTLEKKSKKSKVLEKFSTFTKRKKTPTPDSSAYEHHPSDNATNTYYKWQADGCNSLDYDQHSDPFNFLYDQTSLKSLHNNNVQPEAIRSTNSTNSPNSFDSSTYRKGKMPLELKKQLEQLKHTQNLPEQEDGRQHQTAAAAEGEEETKEDEELQESDKYKTVTLNSLRKSFRDKFMHQQKETPYNPSWFVEVDPPPPPAVLPPAKPPRERSVSKENRSDFLVFDNDNYRPGSRSPIRDINSRRPARSATRSPVIRNETFKVDRNLMGNGKNKDSAASSAIRIEFKNSITPNLPGRMVPVGVAKPMPSFNNSTTDYARRLESPPPSMSKSYIIKSSSSTRLNSQPAPLRNWSKPLSPQSPSRSAINSRPPMGGDYNAPRSGRFQTLVQIKDNTNGYGNLQQSTIYATRPSRHATRIQLGGPSTGLSTGINPPPTTAPAFNKRYSNSKMQPLRQTYFGDNPHQQYAGPTSARLVQMGTRSPFGHKTMTAAPAFNTKYQTPQHHSIATPITTTASSSNLAATQARSTHSYAAAGQYNGGGGSGGGFSYLKHQQQPTARILVASQRRSRSPIKIPWR